MDKIRFGLIGSGWRAEFYIRIAKALPGIFDLTAVLIRDSEKGKKGWAWYRTGKGHNYGI